MPKYTIFKDIDNRGVTFVVYEKDFTNLKSKCIGEFLGDEPEFQDFLAQGEVEDGLDNRTISSEWG